MGIIEWLQQFLFFLNYTIVPLLIALAFLFFIWNAFRFFIYGGASEEGREKAKRLMLYGVGAFVLILGIWGIVYILIYTFGFQNDQALRPDYIDNGGYSNSGGTQSSGGCTDLIFGFTWCGQNSSHSNYTPGSGPTEIPPPPPQTNTLSL